MIWTVYNTSHVPVNGNVYTILTWDTCAIKLQPTKFLAVKIKFIKLKKYTN